MLNKEADVVVVGYGGAGATAAIAAADAGAKVVVLEKTEQGGGNTRCAGGSIREYLDPEKSAKYFHAISLGTMEADICQAYVDESAKNLDWLRRMGGEFERWKSAAGRPNPSVLWAHTPGAEGLGGRWYTKGTGRVGGVNLFNLLADNVGKRSIEVLFETPARRLIFQSGKGVTGVVAEGPEGEVTIMAKRGVVLTCGGFEFNAEMQRNYLGLSLHALGCPANTGDGVTMAQEVGADLWHMNYSSCALGYKVPDYDVPFSHRMRGFGYIYVDQDSKRFVDEAGTDAHAMAFDFLHLDHKNLRYPRIPSYVIFDETARKAGRICQDTGWINDYYEWSSDNSAEVEKGWIKKAHAVRELAVLVGLQPDALEETMSRYNAFCANRLDTETGRSADTLVPVLTPPFYAISITPSLLNTQGGPKRNTLAQVLDVRGQPIKGLFSAGELGSVWGAIYPGAGNVTECLAFGRIAGRNAAINFAPG